MGLIIHLFTDTNKIQLKNTSPAYRMTVTHLVVTVTSTEIRMPANSENNIASWHALMPNSED
jgi:hypothetical protein